MPFIKNFYFQKREQVVIEGTKILLPLNMTEAMEHMTLLVVAAKDIRSMEQVTQHGSDF